MTTLSAERRGATESDPLLSNIHHSNISHNTNDNDSKWWCWFVLFAFSLLSFSSALMWDTFAPCLYIFADYYFDGQVTTATINAINAMSLIYMLIYPLAVQPTLRFFEDKKDVPGSGLKRGILIGAFLNMLGGAIRWCGGAQDRYFVLLLGQTVAAVAQVFMLSIPPRLAGTWFPENQVNLSTSIGVSSNNLGVAAGSIWAPLAIQAATMTKDIPRLLFWQFLLCALALVLVYVSFSRRPGNHKTVSKNNGNTLTTTTTTATLAATSSKINAYDQAKVLWGHRSFFHMLFSYGVLNGGQCALVTLIAQILLPSFQNQADEGYVGWIGFMMLLAGIPASWMVGVYLDKTYQYRVTCNVLSILGSLSVAGIYIAIEFQCLPAVTFNCIIFGLASSAIIPAVFQYASELYYPIDENIPAGYLCTASNVSGVLLAAIMGWTENNRTEFTMRLPVLGLVLITFISNISMFRVKGPLKRHLESSSSQ
ncbi:major facilitator superfamily domain-containing protein [Phascolomyces articulosus]|uniref:Major facilitator superfamily domain-containing protein n=1 Tax=Phascolomyces articulosus TaxID=60185 RepID=A0AAD5PIR5_9FUNG|nr:major facilitator superfamily domain-containing protein [Phascolomyces articulosus]